MEPNVAAAESTPATPDVSQMSQEDFETWRNEGKLPEKKEDSAASEDSSGAPPEGGAEAAPESEPETPAEQKPKKNAESRIKELLADRRSRDEKIEQLNRQITELQGQGGKKAESPVADGSKPTPDDKNDKGEPKYHSYEEYLEALSDWKADQKIIGLKKELQEERAKEKAQQQSKQIEASWQERVNKSSEKHDDYDDVVFADNSPISSIPEGSATDAYILESEQGAEMLYHLAKNGEELDRILKLGPVAQVRELTKIELSLSGSKAPPKKHTSAPDPPAEVGGGGTAAKDEVAKALKQDDFAAFERARNAAERR